MAPWFVELLFRDTLRPVKVVDAACGEAGKVVGYGMTPPGMPVLYSPITGRMCLAYDITVEQYQHFSGEKFDGYDWFCVAREVTRRTHALTLLFLRFVYTSAPLCRLFFRFSSEIRLNRPP